MSNVETAPRFIVGPVLFGGGAEEDLAHLALGEIEDDAAVDRTHYKDSGIGACFAIDMLGVSLSCGALRVPDLDARSSRKGARRGSGNVGDRLRP